jgi:uncharacterized protein
MAARGVRGGEGFPRRRRAWLGRGVSDRGRGRGAGRADGARGSAPDGAARVRIAIRVKPGASCPGVGGAYGPHGALVVAVRERAVDGKASAAALEAVAAALGVPRRSVVLVGGAVSRDKLVAVLHAPADLPGRLAALLAR